MQIKHPHCRFYRLDAIRDELSPQAAELELVAFHYGRMKPGQQRKFNRHAQCWRYGDRSRKPGQMVQIDRTGVAIEASFSVKEFKAVCPVSKLCCMRAYSRATAACASKFLDHLIRQVPFPVESVQVDGGSESAVEFEHLCNACRPHQAPGQTAPMQAYNRNFSQSALTT